MMLSFSGFFFVVFQLQIREQTNSDIRQAFLEGQIQSIFQSIGANNFPLQASERDSSDALKKN